MIFREIKIPYWLYYSVPRASVPVGAMGIHEISNLFWYCCSVIVVCYGIVVMGKRFYEFTHS